MKAEKGFSVLVLLCLVFPCEAYASGLCGDIKFENGITTVNHMMVNDLNRNYGLYVPASYRPGSSLVLDFHGFGTTRVREQRLSCWKNKADQEGFVVVYPQGYSLLPAWNSGPVCCQPSPYDDEGFILQLVSCLADKESSKLEIDNNRIFATGLSNGGVMAGFLACRHSDIFAAALVVSQSYPYRNASVCRTQRASSELKPGFSLLEMRGKQDPIVLYNRSWGVSLTAARSLQLWAETNHCRGEPRVEDICDRPGAPANCVYEQSSCLTYDDCDNDARVIQCGFDYGHLLYGNSQGFDVCSEAWSEFERVSLYK